LTNAHVVKEDTSRQNKMKPNKKQSLLAQFYNDTKNLNLNENGNDSSSDDDDFVCDINEEMGIWLLKKDRNHGPLNTFFLSKFV
jgi:hypothetical protein